MGPDLGIDLMKELGLSGGSNGNDGSSTAGLIESFPPPPPPAKEPHMMAKKKPSQSSLNSSSPIEPPNRPLPLRPVSKVAGGLSRSTTSVSPFTTSTTSLPPPSMPPSVPPPSVPAPNRPPPAKPLPMSVRPQVPLGMNPPTRPGTAATTKTTTSAATAVELPPVSMSDSKPRMSWTSTAASSLNVTRRIKYGQGKYSNVELVPQPSDDLDDPLNWPTWRKELNFWSLMLMVAMTGVTKTIFMTVNAQVSQLYQVSYTSVAALTGVPLILSAASGLGCLIASRIVGRRPLYLGSLIMFFIGTVWNTNVAFGGAYGQCMTARVFQGLGWGAWDALVLGSIQDTFFEHERSLKITIHAIIVTTTLWFSPILGGVASQSSTGFSLQFTILSSFFVLAVPAVTLGCPETVFDRAYTLSAAASAAQTPGTGLSGFGLTGSGKYKTSLPLAPYKLLSWETVWSYLAKLRPYSYSAPISTPLLLQAPRAMIAPTTLLLFLISFLPVSALWSFSSSLSLIFHPLPFNLAPASIGALFVGPFLLSTAIATLFNFYSHKYATIFSSTPRILLGIIAVGSVLSFIGILTFGLHIGNSFTSLDAETSMFAAEYLGKRVSLPAIGFVFGLLAAGAATLEHGLQRVTIGESTAFTSRNLGVKMRNEVDMSYSVEFYRKLMIGIFVMGVQTGNWVVWEGLRGLSLGFGISVMIVSGLVATGWWLYGEQIKRGDGRWMGLVNLNGLTDVEGGMKRSGSFFDTD
ncbi:major facilitator superfamily domain-containing protein [Triangularia verruculosa]|uniref:Major facilitator superfamily domain-containing protein n=1 Tax=Triangularia verruculosa TaxID=2587418 RepID=A0AAN6XG56_9PEZI|nr:major facilitator superfamily domain-containing protein [Triangularia verruculosa]